MKIFLHSLRKDRRVNAHEELVQNEAKLPQIKMALRVRYKFDCRN